MEDGNNLASVRVKAAKCSIIIFQFIHTNYFEVRKLEDEDSVALVQI